MPSSVSCGYPVWLDGGTYNGALMRTQHISASFFNTGAAQVFGGVLASGGQMAVSPGIRHGSERRHRLRRLSASAGSTFGGYLFGLMSAAQGGVLPIWAPTFIPAGYGGLYVHDRSSGRLCHDPAGALVQPILTFTPQRARASSSGPFTPSSGAHTIVSATFTADGNTDVEIIVAWGSATRRAAARTAPRWMSTWTRRNSSGSRSARVTTSLACGGGYTYITQSGVDRPAAGTHAVSLVVTPNAGNAGNLTVNTPMIYVRPAPL